MHAFARQSIQIHRQGGRQGFAFAGAHFRNLAFVQRNATQHLHVEVAHLHDTLGALTNHCKSFRQNFVQGFTLRHASSKLIGFGAQLFIA